MVHGIVVGGGLAGVSAANTILENGGKVVLLDKSSFCGGNSTKATSGINGAGTKTQETKGIKDSVDLFTQDTLRGGAKKPEVVKVLCGNSGIDVDWLVDKFDLDMSLIARMGGHSAPRTHRGKERFPGMTITYALIQMVEKVAERGDLAKIINKAKVTKLLTDSSGACIGCVYEKRDAQFEERGPVILATGGFGADFTDSSLLAKHRPDLINLPTTNGDHTTGDGIKLGEAIGGRSVDLEWVQARPLSWCARSLQTCPQTCLQSLPLTPHCAACCLHQAESAARSTPPVWSSPTTLRPRSSSWQLRRSEALAA